MYVAVSNLAPVQTAGFACGGTSGFLTVYLLSLLMLFCLLLN